jgi:eukaryotic-like serine/threonine-protein kinase
VSDEPVPGIGKDLWLRLSPLLDQALELEGDERAAWLARLRAQDPVLADKVAELLAAHGDLQSEGFLDGAAAPQPAAASLAGLTVGAYTLRAPLGHGGMGSVWLADRTDGRFEGQAAVKLLNASLIGRDGEVRFRREGSILARLRHPNIARLIDAGVSPLGQPYIVLEHVDGERIDAYCESRNLGIPERLRIFLQVLDAVAHAHANLIVHRDVKPQNVLVDRDGSARLLDFGIAKLIDPDPGEQATVTRAGESAMTPEYAAPEQVTGGHVTTATDIYALGVLLCVLLTGRHPAGSSARTPAEWVRAIVDTEPRPMSELAAGAAHGRLGAALRGDLDNIATKALRKNPDERYPSVEAFADDLRRYLRHEPVSARPDTVAYRASRFVRRHPLGVAAAAAAVVAAVVFTAGIAWQAREARRQRDEANTQMARATAAREFMGYLLSVASSPGPAHTPGDLLAKGAALIDKEYAGNEPLQAEMLVAIGEQYMGTESYEKAEPVLERAAALAERSTDPGLLARTLCPLALLRMNKNRQDEANALMTRALGSLPDDSLHALQRADCLIDRGTFGFYTEDAEAMKRDAAAALAILDTVPVPAVSERIDALGVLAYGHYLARESREADAAYAKLMDELKRVGRDDTLLAADTCNNWSLVHYEGNIAKAEPLCRRAVELRRSIEGAGAIAPSVTYNHAAVLFQLARYDEAEPLYEETIRTAHARHEERIETDAMLELADLYVAKGELGRAKAQLENLGPLLTGPKPDPFRKVQMTFYQGRLALAQGDAKTAGERFGSVVDIFEKRHSRLSMFVFALDGLARSKMALGDAAGAATAAGRSVEIAASFVEPGSPSYLIGLAKAALADAQLAGGDREAARASYREALDHLTVTLGNDHPATAAARRGLAASDGA